MKSAFLFAFALAGAGVAAVAAQPAARNWVTTVATTSTGSYVIGNPAAKAKLVEYLSYTCNHCAHFVGEASTTLKQDYVAKGGTSIEVRHAVRDPLDLAASLLARCDGPARFLGHSEAIFAKQTEWMNKGIEFHRANADRLQGMPQAKALAEIAGGSGLTALMQARGMAPAKAQACLVSKPATDQLVAMSGEAWQQRKIPGTPAFLINGTIVAGAMDWAGLKPQLDAAAK
ncbi:thioredoxin domain-containing protein [Sphingomonas sp. LaA6.9]|uniref:thioredoxin domain-containing protein n=1 Tax=Sphingomonas sp. LaA6.9 TaxID=2919914 RepID=UPI001F503D8A|nr:thioredoxin domain-containing protein [Sphingomonas sp. LaA6.9]MCJ8157967.1 DsbA family protein [Sphingomonas sp. LaA6.9]